MIVYTNILLAISFFRSITTAKDTMIFQGPSLNQFGQNPLYRAKKPSFFHVCYKGKEKLTSKFPIISNALIIVSELNQSIFLKN